MERMPCPLKDMSRYIILLITLQFGATAVFCQKGISGNEKGIPFYLSYTNPEFYNSTDSASRQVNFDKYYSLYSYLYAQQKQAGFSPEEQQMLDSLALYIGKRYITENYLLHLNDSIQVTEKDALSYYQRHQTNYSEPGLCSYYQIFALKEDKATIEKAKKKVMELSAIPDSTMPFKGDKNSEFAISYERDVRLLPSFTITSVIENIPINKFSDLLQVPGFFSKVMYYVVDRVSTKTKSFDSVKEDCFNKVKEEKIQREMVQLYKIATNSFPTPIK